MDTLLQVKDIRDAAFTQKSVVARSTRRQAGLTSFGRVLAIE